MDKKLFYQCMDCDRVLLELNSNLPHSCNHDLALLEANSTETSTEKHIPVLKFKGNILHVKVGSIPHPMSPEHSILWIFVQTRKGGIYVDLSPEDKPEAVFMVEEIDLLGVYAYCDIHGLWMADVGDLDYEEAICSSEFPQGCIG